MNRTQFNSNDRSRTSSSWMHRRGFLLGAGAAGMALGTRLGAGYTQIAALRRTIRCASRRCGSSSRPGKVIDTFAYNGTVPGPVLRLREGRQVSIDIRNDTDIDESCTGTGSTCPRTPTARWRRDRRWSGAAARGATRFAAKPAGTRWYHSHDVAGKDLTRSLYPGCTAS